MTGPPQQPAAEQAPDPLAPEHLQKLVDNFMAGFVSGMTTLLLQGHSCSDPDCPLPALAALRATAFAQLSLSDPAFRHDLAAGCELKWHHPDAPLPMQKLDAYPAAWNGGKL